MNKQLCCIVLCVLLVVGFAVAQGEGVQLPAEQAGPAPLAAFEQKPTPENFNQLANPTAEQLLLVATPTKDNFRHLLQRDPQQAASYLQRRYNNDFAVEFYKDKASVGKNREVDKKYFSDTKNIGKNHDSDFSFFSAEYVSTAQRKEQIKKNIKAAPEAALAFFSGGYKAGKNAQIKESRQNIKATKEAASVFFTETYKSPYQIDIVGDDFVFDPEAGTLHNGGKTISFENYLDEEGVKGIKTVKDGICVESNTETCFRGAGEGAIEYVADTDEFVIDTPQQLSLSLFGMQGATSVDVDETGNFLIHGQTRGIVAHPEEEIGHIEFKNLGDEKTGDKLIISNTGDITADNAIVNTRRLLLQGRFEKKGKVIDLHAYSGKQSVFVDKITTIGAKTQGQSREKGEYVRVHLDEVSPASIYKKKVLSEEEAQALAQQITPTDSTTKNAEVWIKREGVKTLVYAKGPVEVSHYFVERDGVLRTEKDEPAVDETQPHFTGKNGASSFDFSRDGLIEQFRVKGQVVYGDRHFGLDTEQNGAIVTKAANSDGKNDHLKIECVGCKPDTNMGTLTKKVLAVQQSGEELDVLGKRVSFLSTDRGASGLKIALKNTDKGVVPVIDAQSAHTLAHVLTADENSFLAFKKNTYLLSQHGDDVHYFGFTEAGIGRYEMRGEDLVLANPAEVNFNVKLMTGGQILLASPEEIERITQVAEIIASKDYDKLRGLNPNDYSPEIAKVIKEELGVNPRLLSGPEYADSVIKGLKTVTGKWGLNKRAAVVAKRLGLMTQEQLTTSLGNCPDAQCRDLLLQQSEEKGLIDEKGNCLNRKCGKKIQKAAAGKGSKARAVYAMLIKKGQAEVHALEAESAANEEENKGIKDLKKQVNSNKRTLKQLKRQFWASKFEKAEDKEKVLQQIKKNDPGLYKDIEEARKKEEARLRREQLMQEDIARAWAAAEQEKEEKERVEEMQQKDLLSYFGSLQGTDESRRVRERIEARNEEIRKKLTLIEEAKSRARAEAKYYHEKEEAATAAERLFEPVKRHIELLRAENARDRTGINALAAQYADRPDIQASIYAAAGDSATAAGFREIALQQVADYSKRMGTEVTLTRLQRDLVGDLLRVGIQSQDAGERNSAWGKAKQVASQIEQSEDWEGAQQEVRYFTVIAPAQKNLERAQTSEWSAIETHERSEDARSSFLSYFALVTKARELFEDPGGQEISTIHNMRGIREGWESVNVMLDGGYSLDEISQMRSEDAARILGKSRYEIGDWNRVVAGPAFRIMHAEAGGPEIGRETLAREALVKAQQIEEIHGYDAALPYYRAAHEQFSGTEAAELAGQRQIAHVGERFRKSGVEAGTFIGDILIDPLVVATAGATVFLKAGRVARFAEVQAKVAGQMAQRALALQKLGKAGRLTVQEQKAFRYAATLHGVPKTKVDDFFRAANAGKLTAGQVDDIIKATKVGKVKGFVGQKTLIFDKPILTKTSEQLAAQAMPKAGLGKRLMGKLGGKEARLRKLYREEDIAAALEKGRQEVVRLSGKTPTVRPGTVAVPKALKETAPEVEVLPPTQADLAINSMKGAVVRARSANDIPKLQKLADDLRSPQWKKTYAAAGKADELEAAVKEIDDFLAKRVIDVEPVPVKPPKAALPAVVPPKAALPVLKPAQIDLAFDRLREAARQAQNVEDVKRLQEAAQVLRSPEWRRTFEAAGKGDSLETVLKEVDDVVATRLVEPASIDDAFRANARVVPDEAVKLPDEAPIQAARKVAPRKAPAEPLEEIVAKGAKVVEPRTFTSTEDVVDVVAKTRGELGTHSGISGGGSIADRIPGGTPDADLLISSIPGKALEEQPFFKFHKEMKARAAKSEELKGLGWSESERAAGKGTLEEVGYSKYNEIKYDPFAAPGVDYNSRFKGSLVLRDGTEIDLIAGFGYSVPGRSQLDKGFIEVFGKRIPVVKKGDDYELLFSVRGKDVRVPIEKVSERNYRAILFELDANGVPTHKQFFRQRADGIWVMNEDGLRLKYTFEQRPERLKLLDEIARGARPPLAAPKLQIVGTTEVVGSPGAVHAASGTEFSNIEDIVSSVRTQGSAEVKTSLGMAGTGAQRSVHPYAGDIDFVERVNLVSAGDDTAAFQALAQDIQRQVASTQTGDVVFLEMKAGIDPTTLHLERPKALKWNAQEVAKGEKFVEGYGVVRLEDAVSHEGMLKIDFSAKTADGYTETTKVMFVTVEEAATGNIRRVNFGSFNGRPMETLYQEVYGAAEDLRALRKQLDASPAAQEGYLRLMETELTTYTGPKKENFLKSGKRLYNYLLTKGEVSVADSLQPLFRGESARLGKIAGDLDHIDDILKKGAKVDMDVLARQVDVFEAKIRLKNPGLADEVADDLSVISEAVRRGDTATARAAIGKVYNRVADVSNQQAKEFFQQNPALYRRIQEGAPKAPPLSHQSSYYQRGVDAGDMDKVLTSNPHMTPIKDSPLLTVHTTETVDLHQTAYFFGKAEDFKAVEGVTLTADDLGRLPAAIEKRLRTTPSELRTSNLEVLGNSVVIRVEGAVENEIIHAVLRENLLAKGHSAEAVDKFLAVNFKFSQPAVYRPHVSIARIKPDILTDEFAFFRLWEEFSATGKVELSSVQKQLAAGVSNPAEIHAELTNLFTKIEEANRAGLPSLQIRSTGLERVVKDKPAALKARYTLKPEAKPVPKIAAVGGAISFDPFLVNQNVLAAQVSVRIQAAPDYLLEILE